MNRVPIEFLVAWDDHTWTTEVERVPGRLLAHGDQGDAEFEQALLAWAHTRLGQRPKYQGAVAFAIYSYPEE